MRTEGEEMTDEDALKPTPADIAVAKAYAERRKWAGEKRQAESDYLAGVLAERERAAQEADAAYIKNVVDASGLTLAERIRRGPQS